MQKNDPRQKLIDRVIRDFDYERVQKAMMAVDWQWQATNNDGFEFPSIDRMKACSKLLLMAAAKYGISATGGFEATYSPKVDDEDECFTLRFVLCSVDSDCF